MTLTPERHGASHEPLPDDADQLRALVSTMLSGTYKEESYLWDVASLCRSKPEFAHRLLGLIDRYQRLGQMPTAQYRKIKEKIEQSLSSSAPRSPAVTTAAVGARRHATRHNARRASTITTELSPGARGQPLQPPGPTITAPLPMVTRSASSPPRAAAPPLPAARAPAAAARPGATPSPAAARAPPTAPPPVAARPAVAIPPAAATARPAVTPEPAVAPALAPSRSTATPSARPDTPPPAAAPPVIAPSRAASPSPAVAPPPAVPPPPVVVSSPAIAASTVAATPPVAPAPAVTVAPPPVASQRIPALASAAAKPSAAAPLAAASIPPSSEADLAPARFDFDGPDAVARLMQSIGVSVDPAPATSIEPGSVLRNRYELQELLGYGGMASVYRAADRVRASLGLSDSSVALKLVVGDDSNTAKVAALGREFHNAQKLSHPNIVNVYEIDHEADASFYTMELLQGQQLNQLLERIGKPLPTRYALAIIRDIGSAVAHAHSRGVVHADLKPQNIFITQAGQVRVLDFGGLSLSSAALSGAAREPRIEEPRIEELPAAQASDSYLTATPAYASCEQLEGQRIDVRDDVYSLACIAYELLTGRHPFDGKSSLEARAQHLHARRPAVLNASSWRALRRGLAWQRAQRPRHIPAWLEQLGVAAAVEHLPPSDQLRADPARRRRLAPLAMAALLMLLLGGGWLLWQQGVLDWGQTLATAQSAINTARQRVGSALERPRVLTPTSSPTVAPTTPDNLAQTNPPPANPPVLPQGPLPTVRASTARASTPSAASGAGPNLLTGEVRAAKAPATPATAHSASGASHASAVASVSARASAAAGAGAGAAASAGAGAGAAGGSTAAGDGLAFGSASYVVANGAPAARLIVLRSGNSNADVRFVWWTIEDSAKADVDFAPLGRRVERIPRGANALAIFVPIISNPLRHQTVSFYVALGAADAENPQVPSARATVTIDRSGKKTPRAQ